MNLPEMLKQVKKERAQVERQLSGLDVATRAFSSVYTGGRPGRNRHKMSAKSREKIAAAQRVQMPVRLFPREELFEVLGNGFRH